MTMNSVGWGIVVLMFAILAGLFIAIIQRQKNLDAPCKGLLIVDKTDTEGPCMVYLQAIVDPGEFKEGELVKLKVRHTKFESQ